MSHILNWKTYLNQWESYLKRWGEVSEKVGDVEYVWNPSPVGAVDIELWLISCIWHFWSPVGAVDIELWLISCIWHFWVILNNPKSATITYALTNYSSGMLISCIVHHYLLTVHSYIIYSPIWLSRVLQSLFYYKMSFVSIYKLW